jgi:5-methylcytosine-specific restriction protein A
MKKSLPDTIPLANLIAAIEAFDAGRTHLFEAPRRYEVVYKGRGYPPKAIVGIAASDLLGVEFGPEDFTGGIKSKCHKLLTDQGFKIRAKADVDTLPTQTSYPGELDEDENAQFAEGAVIRVTVNRFERDPYARKAALQFHGSQCKVCEIAMADVYGEIAEGFIHMHHLVPLSAIREEYKLNPETDLIPVCPNCHAMLHKRHPPFTPDELREIMRKNT